MSTCLMPLLCVNCLPYLQVCYLSSDIAMTMVNCNTLTLDVSLVSYFVYIRAVARGGFMGFS